MTDVLKLLPPFEWRGIRYPVTSRNVTSAQEAVEHKVQYADGVFIEPLGAGSKVFTYTIPMREDIAKGPYKNLFTMVLKTLWKDCHNREPGILIDPVYGQFRCTPKLFSDDTDVNKRDGTDVRVEFTYAPDPLEKEQADRGPNIGELVADAGQLDQVLKLQDWEIQEPPEGMTDILSGINGMMRQGMWQIDKLSYQLDDVAFRLKKIEDTVDLVENPANWHFRQSVRNLRSNTHTLNQKLTENPLVKIKRHTVNHASTVSVVASQVGMSVDDLLKLNPGLSKSPKIIAGTVLNIR